MLRLASGIDHDPLPESDQGGVHLYRPGEKITSLCPERLCFLGGELGFRMVQIAAGPHFNEDIGPDGRGDWGPLDHNLRIISEQGAEALLVAGFYWIPPWMREDPRAVPLRCLQHHQTVPILSPWSPFTLEWIDHCAGALAAHLQASPAPIAAVGVMLCGDFGEAIFPAGMLNTAGTLPPSVDGQTIHDHGDFWCDDPCARAAYVDFLGKGGRRARPGHSPPDPSDAGLFPRPPAPGTADLPWLDFLDWYHDSMTRYAGEVMACYRAHFPNPDLVIWLGGGVEPHTHGQDNSALPKAAKAVRGTIRCTAAGSQLMHRKLEDPGQTLAWAFQRNQPIVKRVASACRHYGVPLWLEPPYPPGMDEPEIVARVFEAASCGAEAYFEWARTLERCRGIYKQCTRWLVASEPLLNAAVYFPVAAHRTRPDSLLPPRFWDGAASLRAVTDYDVLDDRLIRDGALDRYALLVLLDADLIEPDVLERVRHWVEAGGILAVEWAGAMRCVGRDDEILEPWLGLAPGAGLCHTRLDLPAVGGDTDPWPDARVRFAHANLCGFPRIAEDAETIIPACPGAAGVSRSVGQGRILTVARNPGRFPLLASVVLDVLLGSPAGPLDAARAAAQCMRGRGRLFATAFPEGVLLANLTPEPAVAEHGGRTARLPPYSIEFAT